PARQSITECNRRTGGRLSAHPGKSTAPAAKSRNIALPELIDAPSAIHVLERAAPGERVNPDCHPQVTD
ncbi:MAG: hypothetical protein ACYCW7_15855, partial [Pseudomonadaceae bacterium]